MKPYTATIIDDESDAAQLLYLTLQELFPNILVTRICTGWADALQALKEKPGDLVFLDIMMPGKTGLELLRLLPGIRSAVIFVTAHQEYALEAFKCYASGYLLKPVDDRELHEVVTRVIDGFERSTEETDTAGGLLGIPGSKGIDYISMEDILYLRSEQKCTRIVLKDRTMLSSHYLGRFKDFLNGDRFFQVHRSFIVNLKAIKRYTFESACIIMSDNAEIPVARPVREVFLQKFATLKKQPG